MKNINSLLIILLFFIVSGCSSLGTAPPLMVSADSLPDNDCVALPYIADEINGAYETILPVSKSRAKELYVDSATPLGFRFNKSINDEVTVLARSTDRGFSLDKGLEGHLYSRFKELKNGTRIYVDSESLEMVGKSRDHSYAKSIIKHMICLHSIFDVDDKGRDQLQNSGPAKSPQEIELLNYRLISSRTAQNGEQIKFIVKDNIVDNGKIIIKRGAVAQGHVLEAKSAGAFGVKGKLIISIDKVQGTTGKWIPLLFKSDKNTLDVQSERDLFSGLTLPIAYALAQGAQPSVPSGVVLGAKINLSQGGQ